MANGKDDKFNEKDLNGFLKGLQLSPEQIAIVTAILINALEVQSILLDRDQTLQILLIGDLGKKTESDEFIQEVGGMTFVDLVNSMVRNRS